MSLKPLGWSLLAVAALVHYFFIYWSGFTPKPRVSSDGLAFFCGLVLPILLVGVGLSLALRKK